MRALRLTALLIVMSLLIAGCGGQLPFMEKEEAAPKKPEPPEWLKGQPKRSGMVCAIGASEPTYYIEKARENAAEKCRADLARAIEVQIKTVTLDVLKSKGTSSTESSTVTMTTAAITDAVVENAEVLDYWLDTEGVLSNKKNITYALCCIPESKFKK